MYVEVSCFSLLDSAIAVLEDLLGNIPRSRNVAASQDRVEGFEGFGAGDRERYTCPHPGFKQMIEGVDIDGGSRRSETHFVGKKSLFL